MSEIMAEEELIIDELRAELPEATVRANEPLARRTTLRAGGPADIYVEPSSEKELACVVQICGERDVPMMILGRGSNLLIRDGGIRGRGGLPGPSGFLRDRGVRAATALRRGREIEVGVGLRSRGGIDGAGISGGHSRQRGRRAADERRRDGRRDF